MTRQKTNTLWFATLAIAMMAAGLSGCSKGNAETARRGGAKKVQPKRELSPINVKVQTLKKGTLTETIQVTGVTGADAEVTYSAELPGRVDYVGSDIGRRVRTGQVLARIDYASLKAQADQAQASHDLAKKTHQRIKALRAEELASEQTLDEARSRMISAEAALRIARVNLKKSVIVAKRPGVVTEKHVERGEYVGPGAPAFTVVDYRTIIVEAQLPESQATLVAARTAARVRVGALGETFDGKVQTVIPVAEKVSKTYRLRVVVNNRDLGILVGMAASVLVPARQHEGVVVARQDAVLEGERRSVFVVDGSVARRRYVTLGPTHDDQVVLLSGVRAGERLVVLGQRDLRDGQPVRVIN
jgi:RND family efflux transporter MFP subunit